MMRPLLLLCWALFLPVLGACARMDLDVSRAPGGDSVPITPRLQVFIAPEQAVTPPLGSALICRLEIPYHDQARKEGLRRIIQGALLQTRLFSGVIDLEDATDYEDYMEAGAFGYALDHGVSYCIEVFVEKLVSPVGNGPGFCALSLRVKRTRDRVTIYSVYGEAELVPKRERNYIFYTTSYRKAPTILQGIISILRAMAQELTSTRLRG